MARFKRTVPAWKCDRCAHIWIPRSWRAKPIKCPSCSSARWDATRRRQDGA